jgi:hypothetical protein
VTEERENRGKTGGNRPLLPSLPSPAPLTGMASPVPVVALNIQGSTVAVGKLMRVSERGSGGAGSGCGWNEGVREEEVGLLLRQKGRASVMALGKSYWAVWWAGFSFPSVSLLFSFSSSFSFTPGCMHSCFSDQHGITPPRLSLA